jgi:hypothetical protein
MITHDGLSYGHMHKHALEQRSLFGMQKRASPTRRLPVLLGRTAEGTSTQALDE